MSDRCCVLATLCFIIEQLLLIAFTFMFNVLQILLHNLKPKQTNKQHKTRTKKKKSKKERREKCYKLVPPLPQIKTFFSIESNLGSWWTVELTNLRVLKHTQTVPSWFKEETKRIINHQLHNIICCKLGAWLITVIQA